MRLLRAFHTEYTLRPTSCPSALEAVRSPSSSRFEDDQERNESKGRKRMVYSAGATAVTVDLQAKMCYDCRRSTRSTVLTREGESRAAVPGVFEVSVSKMEKEARRAMPPRRDSFSSVDATKEKHRRRRVGRLSMHDRKIGHGWLSAPSGWRAVQLGRRCQRRTSRRRRFATARINHKCESDRGTGSLVSSKRTRYSTDL